MEIHIFDANNSFQCCQDVKVDIRIAHVLKKILNFVINKYSFMKSNEKCLISNSILDVCIINELRSITNENFHPFFNSS